MIPSRLPKNSISKEPKTSHTRQVEKESSSTLRPYDILCGRNKDAFNNIGNRRFRVTVSLWLNRYVNAPSRQEKSNIVKAIFEQVEATGGRFLKRNSKSELVQLNRKQTHDKIGHALRDMTMARGRVTSLQSNKRMRYDVPDEPIKSSRRNSSGTITTYSQETLSDDRDTEVAQVGVSDFDHLIATPERTGSSSDSEVLNVPGTIEIIVKDIKQPPIGEEHPCPCDFSVDLDLTSTCLCPWEKLMMSDDILYDFDEV